MYSIGLLLGLLAVAPPDDAKKARLFLDEARKHYENGDSKTALSSLEKAAMKNPKNADIYLLRGQVYAATNEHAKAVADFSRAIELDPQHADAYDLRGSAHFMAGKVVESAADFDRYIKMKPDAFNGHWRRGISLYYAGRFADGRKQFEGYEKVDTNDVENAVWHFLCVARKDGVEQARKQVLRIGRDRRIPMMAVYELFKGAIRPEDVLKAVEEGQPNAREKGYRLFYAHLYLGLYYEVTGDAKKALTHLEESVKQPRVHPYMWDVARVHRDLLKEKKKDQ